jgi:hypothetical protein
MNLIIYIFLSFLYHNQLGTSHNFHLRGPRGMDEIRNGHDKVLLKQNKTQIILRGPQ